MNNSGVCEYILKVFYNGINITQVGGGIFDFNITLRNSSNLTNDSVY